MGILQRLFSRFAGKPATNAGKRMFQAGLSSRLTASWAVGNASADGDIFRALDIMRARSRDLANNNDYVKKWLRTVANNIVGATGFALQCHAEDPDGTPDRLATTAIESAFAKWCQVGTCEVTGRLSFVDLQHVIIKAVARDGEALVRRVRDQNENAYGYALQLLDIDRLLVNYNQTLDNGNYIRMGIEMNSRGRPVAYHLRTIHPGDSLSVTADGQTVRIERVPATDIFHLFRTERPEQHRGYPWAHASMLRLNMLAGYEEAALVASRTGAAKMGFFTSPDGDIAPLADGQDETGEFVSDADPGSFTVLPKGYDFKEWNPDYPVANFGPFVKACLRAISSGLGISYHSLANDLEGVNYSSIRAGTLEERDAWMVDQNWFAGVFLRPLFLDWLQMSLLRGAIKMPNGSALPATKLEKFGMHHWQGRRWAWVDPLNDVEANLAAVNGLLKSRRAVVAEQGQDMETVWKDLQKENDLMEEMGLTPNEAPAPAQPDNSLAPAS